MTLLSTIRNILPLPSLACGLNQNVELFLSKSGQMVKLRVISSLFTFQDVYARWPISKLKNFNPPNWNLCSDLTGMHGIILRLHSDSLRN